MKSKFYWLWVWIILCCLPAFAAAPRVGEWAEYEPIPSAGVEAPYRSLRLSVIRLEDQGSDAVEMIVHLASGRMFVVQIAMDPLSLDVEPREKSAIRRYALQEGDEDALEYVHAETGKPLLPEFFLLRDMLPAGSGSSQDGFFSEGKYLGFAIRRVQAGSGATPLIQRALMLRLNPDVILGTGRNFRDREGHRLWNNDDYQYVRFIREDYDTMIAAGINQFWVDAEQEEWIRRLPVFYLVQSIGLAFRYPEELYRGNFRGRVMFLDEPGHYLRQRFRQHPNEALEFTHPRQAADILKEMSETAVQGEGSYGTRFLLRSLKDAGFALGDWEIIQTNFPVWETVPGVAFYEMEAGLPGYVFEARFMQGRYPQQLNAFFGSHIPCDPANHFRYYYGLFRGAARVWGGDWGTAIYGQVDESMQLPTLTYAYDMGARYFWFWTSDKLHHVPWSEQLDLSRRLLVYINQHPRPGKDAALHAAHTAIAIPYGYTFEPGFLFDIPFFDLDHLNDRGFTYRDILSLAAAEMDRCIRDGVEFDLVVDHPQVLEAGYESVIRIQEDGQVSVIHHGEERLRTEHLVMEDNLPAPKLKVSAEPKSGTAPLKVVFKATVTETARPVRMPGGRSREDGSRNIGKTDWILFDPPGSPRNSNGDELIHTFEHPGRYRVEAWTWDIDGRASRREVNIVVHSATGP